jgi:chromosome segregation ATPase
MKNMKYICMLVFVAVVHVVCSSIFFTFSESTKLLNQKIDTVQQLQGDVEQKVKAIEAANDSIKVKVEQHDVSDTSMEQQVKAISDTVKEVEQSVQVIEQARDKAEELVADANARATAAEEEIARIKAETNAAEMKSEEAAADANVRANAAEEEIARIKAETNAAEMKSEATEDKKHLIEQKVKASNDEASKQVQQNVEQVAKNQQVILKQGNDTEFFLSSQIITIDNSYSISYLPLQTTIGLRFIAVPTKMPL